MVKGDRPGEFELCMMLAVVRLAGDAYGVEIRRRIEGETGRAVTIGATYTTLGRLEEKGLARYRLTEPQAVAGSRARKIFALTNEGTRALSRSPAVLNRLFAGRKARVIG